MNKYFIVGIVLVLIVVAGILWKQYGASAENAAIETGVVKDLTIISKKLEWRFEPETIQVEQGDKINLTIINEDDFDHGFSIDAFGISQRLPANQTIYLNFVASKSGEFPFYCSVSCSDSKNTGDLPDGVVQTGPYAGKFRGHFEQIGKFVVSAVDAVAGN